MEDIVTPLIECETLTGRRRQICTGEASIPLNGSNSINAYRLAWGFAPLAERPRPVPGSQKPLTTPAKKQAKPPKFQPMTKFPGKNMARLLNHYGVATKEGCGCDPWVKAMDQGPEWCRAHFDEIQARLESKAAELRTKETLLIGVRMLLDGQWPTIPSLIHRAIREAERVAGQCGK